MCFALLSLTVLRMIPVAVSLARSGLQPLTVLYLGWSGPRGLAPGLYGYLVGTLGGALSTSSVFMSV